MYHIALLPGDGIGPEVCAEARKVLDAVAQKFGHTFTYEEGLIGGAAYDEHGEHFPDSTKELMHNADAVLFGSVGGPVDQQDNPKWKDAERIAILGMRKELNLAINLRPATVYPQLTHLSPVKEEIIGEGVDLLVVRELIGGIYFGKHDTQGGVAVDEMTYTEEQIRRPLAFAFQAAQQRRKHLTLVDKANVLDCSRLWRKVAEEMRGEYSDVTLEYQYIDNAVMQIIRNPSQYDVIVTGNMFGDILSDASSVLPGSLGLMPSASLGDKVHLFEPIGGSAPDIAGQGIANPIAQILSAALLLRYSFEMEEEAQAIESAVQSVLASGVRTGDIARGDDQVLGTVEIGDAIVSAIAYD